MSHPYSAELTLKEFLSALPKDLIQMICTHIKHGHTELALNLACQYTVTLFRHVTYANNLHHGHFVQALIQYCKSK